MVQPREREFFTSRCLQRGYEVRTVDVGVLFGICGRRFYDLSFPLKLPKLRYLRASNLWTPLPPTKLTSLFWYLLFLH